MHPTTINEKEFAMTGLIATVKRLLSPRDSLVAELATERASNAAAAAEHALQIAATKREVDALDERRRRLEAQQRAAFAASCAAEQRESAIKNKLRAATPRELAALRRVIEQTTRTLRPPEPSEETNPLTGARTVTNLAAFERYQAAVATLTRVRAEAHGPIEWLPDAALAARVGELRRELDAAVERISDPAEVA